MEIKTLDLDKILTEQSMSPRHEVNPAHVDEFVELEGNWPPVLVRPIVHKWFEYQLIDGFHRLAAAERLNHFRLEARIEAMDDATALARALRENQHGLHITPEERKARVVTLRRQGKSQEWIAKETGVSKMLVSKYLASERVEEEIVKSFYNSDDRPDLTLNQSAALAKILPPDPDAQPAGRKSMQDIPRLVTTHVAPKPDPKAVQREHAKPLIPVIAKAAAEHKLPPPVVSALSDAALVVPSGLPRIVEKAVTDGLSAGEIRTLTKVMADPTTPPALVELDLQPGNPIQMKDGVMTADLQAHIARGFANLPTERMKPLTQYLTRLHDYQNVTDEHISIWAEMLEVDEWEDVEFLIDQVNALFDRLRQAHAQRFKTQLRLVQ